MRVRKEREREIDKRRVFVYSVPGSTLAAVAAAGTTHSGSVVDEQISHGAVTPVA